MSNLYDQLYAFPFTLDFADGSQVTHKGMTLRDYFAVKAMQYWLSLPITKDQIDEVASESYRIADAMLKEREK
jgi:hypothetical protein